MFFKDLRINQYRNLAYKIGGRDSLVLFLKECLKLIDLKQPIDYKQIAKIVSKIQISINKSEKYL